jgi:MFS superfamily sulfate permease-like transporter
MATTFILSVVWDLETGIVVALLISLVLVVRRSAKPRLTILVRARALHRSRATLTLPRRRRAASAGPKRGSRSMRTPPRRRTCRAC